MSATHPTEAKEEPKGSFRNRSVTDKTKDPFSTFSKEKKEDVKKKTRAPFGSTTPEAK